jgi:ATP-dependent protease Clp ATPase subunit
MLDVMFDVPSLGDIASVSIDQDVVEGKSTPVLRRRSKNKSPKGDAA